MGYGHNMKGIIERNGHIQITVNFNRKRYRKTLFIEPTAPNFKYAAMQQKAWLHQLTLGSTPAAFIREDHVLVSSLLTHWLKHKETEVKASTFDGYRKCVALLCQHFGNTNTSELSIGKIKNYCTESKAAAKRLNNLFSPLRQALQEAVEDDSNSLTKNILTGWACKKKNGQKTPSIIPFSIDEQRLILQQLTGQAKNLVQFIFWTGTRTSEFIALKWSDVNFDERTINIDRALTQAANKVEDTKTDASERTIKLLSPAFNALLEQKQYTYELGEEIFHNPKTNVPWTGDQQVRKSMWIPAIKKSGVSYRRPYQTRHTYASMLLSAGEHPIWVANQMGHADWSMIAKIYGKWMPEAQPDAGSKAEAIFAADL
jgi:integrase